MKGLITALCLSFTTFNAIAALITYNGYTLNEDTNIVSNSSLEWLQWDETKSFTIKSAVDSYEAEGWRLATTKEMVGLFNDFGFGYYQPWVEDETISQAELRYNDYLVEDISTDPELQFVALWGWTFSHGEYADPINPSYAAGAIFGSDENENGLYQTAYVMDDYIYVTEAGRYEYGSAAILERELMDNNSLNQSLGVALVREITKVNAPSNLIFILIFLTSICGRLNLTFPKNTV